MGLTLDSITGSDHDRANVMFTYADDPRGLISDTLAAISEAGYGDADEPNRMPEPICGPVSGLIGAAMLYEVWQRFEATGGALSGYDYDEVFTGAQAIAHGAQHGDSLALALYGLQFPDIIDRLKDWVFDNLAGDVEDVMVLAGFAGDFDAWESETPDDAA